MQTDLNRMSFEANPPFAIKPQKLLGSRVRRTRPYSEGLMFTQADSAQCVRSDWSMQDIGSFARLVVVSSMVDVEVSLDVQRATAAQAPAPPSTTIDQLQTGLEAVPAKESVWDILESLAGTIEAAPDWAAEHDHYLYSTPKRG